MNFLTIEPWDAALWRRAEPILDEGFPAEGRKTSAMIRKIVDTQAGYVVVGLDGERPAAVAVTGKLPELDALLIDYVAVGAADRGRGFGREMIEELARLARGYGYRGIVIEVEAEASEENDGRKRFWTSVGFRLTEYVQRYRWVPETYQAMYRELTPDAPLPHDGETLFDSIMGFHGKIYR
ncbi:GNAT family N-acetyltransferase [Paenibacillus sp. TRM 82003]|nr:GNAT family N-acetyltransferase [Paenibacillus sp. TRM 82003]